MNYYFSQQYSELFVQFFIKQLLAIAEYKATHNASDALLARLTSCRVINNIINNLR